MDRDSILKKFGQEFVVTDDTYIMGIHRLFGEKLGARFQGLHRVLDACSGAGFTALAIARVVDTVVAVDINPAHIQLARENVCIAGLESKVEFIEGDLTDDTLWDKIGDIDGAQLDPDWAPPGAHKKMHVSSLEEMSPPADVLLRCALSRTENISCRLPKTIELSELDSFPPHEIEKNYLNEKFCFYTVYFGKLIREIGITELRLYE